MKKIIALFGLIAVTACANLGNNNDETVVYATPTVDYVERLDINSAPQPDSFLNQLAMNYRSFAIFNARQSGYPDIGEVFAQKAVVAFSGETPMPETIDGWEITDQDLGFELSRACQELIKMLKNDMSDYCPIEAAEAQAKFDCWLTASSSGQTATSNECRTRFHSVMEVLRNGGPNGCGTTTKAPEEKTAPVEKAKDKGNSYYPDSVAVMPSQMRAREGIVIVNNVNIPERLINPEPVQPLVFNQNIYGGDKTVNNGTGMEKETVVSTEEKKSAPDMVSRQEFIEMMLAMRQEIHAINERLDNATKEETTILKVQQIPLEPKQHVMEEVFEVHFDFNKAIIKPEYEKVIRQLAKAAQESRNVKISVVGHTDTKGTQNYNFALGGRRAKAVRNMLVKYGIPSDQIVLVSSGEYDLKVPTKDGVKNSENRRARVIKEQRYVEMPNQPQEVKVVEEQEVKVSK